MSQTHEGPDCESTPSTPRWVKVSVIITGVLVLLIVGLMVFSGGKHGPGRHLPSGDAGGQTPTSSVAPDHTPPIEHGGQQP